MRCRCCGEARFEDLIDLGRMPLVNSLPLGDEGSCRTWPLKVVMCVRCSLAQLTETPEPEAMFSDYPYFSSQSHTMLEHARQLVARFVAPGQHVVEIASNDGYLLQPAKYAGATVLGVEPARNVAEHALRTGIPTVCEFFSESLAERLLQERGPADVLFANNVLAHVPDPNGFMRGVRIMIGDQGVAHVEVPWLMPMLDMGAFDTIYHEHQCYFSANALRMLCNQNGLRVTDVSFHDVHGGTLHLQIRAAGDQSRFDHWCQQERDRGLFEPATLQAFVDRVLRMKESLLSALDAYEFVAGYGAAAKGVVLLNHFGIDRSRVRWVADVSPHKQGRRIPGTGQPIVPPSALLEDRPEAVLLLPWNLASEIARRNKQYLDRGGRFIVTTPTLRVISNDRVEAMASGI